MTGFVGPTGASPFIPLSTGSTNRLLSEDAASILKEEQQLRFNLARFSELVSSSSGPINNDRLDELLSQADARYSANKAKKLHSNSLSKRHFANKPDPISQAPSDLAFALLIFTVSKLFFRLLNIVRPDPGNTGVEDWSAVFTTTVNSINASQVHTVSFQHTLSRIGHLADDLITIRGLLIKSEANLKVKVQIVALPILGLFSFMYYSKVLGLMILSWGALSAGYYLYYNKNLNEKDHKIHVFALPVLGMLSLIWQSKLLAITGLILGGWNVSSYFFRLYKDSYNSYMIKEFLHYTHDSTKNINQLKPNSYLYDYYHPPLKA